MKTSNDSLLKTVCLNLGAAASDVQFDNIKLHIPEELRPTRDGCYRLTYYEGEEAATAVERITGRAIVLSKTRQIYNPYAKRPPRPAAAKFPPVNTKYTLSGCTGTGVDARTMWTATTALRRYPRICAHIICASLGYAMPRVAGQVLADALNGQENWCEWIFSCYNRDPIRAVRWAISQRQSHRGYMAEYVQAYGLVCQELEGVFDHGRMASWY